MAQSTHDIPEIADMFEFVVRLYKITGNLPHSLALPKSTSSEIVGREYETFRIKSSLLNDRISFSEFIQLSQGLSDIIKVSEKLAIQNGIVRDFSEPRIIYLSLQSPLEVIFALALGLPPALLKLITWYQDVVLKHIEIEKGKIELETLHVEQELRLLELQQKIQNELPKASTDDTKKLVIHLHNHLSLIRDSDSFLDYEASTDREKEVIKSLPKQIPSHPSPQVEDKK